MNHNPTRHARIRTALISGSLVSILLLLSGCAATSYFDSHPPGSVGAASGSPHGGRQTITVRYPPGAHVHRHSEPEHEDEHEHEHGHDEPADQAHSAMHVETRALESVGMFIARGEALSVPVHWDEIIAAVLWADVVVLGEQHNDAVAHAVQQAIVADAIAQAGQRAITVAMEMLERDEQALLDDYLDGIIDQQTLIERTDSADWGARGGWIPWYQPVIDAARDGQQRVIAANAPRRYVRLARTAGYDRLRSLDDNRRRLFALPIGVVDAGYRERFFEVMGGMAGHGDAADSQAQTALIESILRSQLVWDATMADSVVRGRRQHGGAVILLVGQFHSDFDGELVQQIRKRDRSAKILSISMQPRAPGMLREVDVDRADVVIYTGESAVH